MARPGTLHSVSSDNNSPTHKPALPYSCPDQRQMEEPICPLSHVDKQLHLSKSHTQAVRVPKPYLPPHVPGPTQEPC